MPEADSLLGRPGGSVRALGAALSSTPVPYSTSRADGACRYTACVAPKSAGRTLRSAAGRGKRMIFAQMAGLLAMPTLLPEGVLSAEGEDAQAVNSS